MLSGFRRTLVSLAKTVELLSQELLDYSDRFTTDDDPVMNSLLEETLKTHPHAHMISGKVQGRFLETLSRIMAPKRILEIGTFTGYSALALARGLAPEGKLHTVEVRDSDADTAERYFNISGYSDRITLHRGNALEIIPTLNEDWDLVFLDADKTGYAAYYDLILPNLRPGGVILADNVLFHGQVLENPVKGKNAKAIHAFNEKVRSDSRVETVLLTVRDGILMIRKK